MAVETIDGMFVSGHGKLLLKEHPHFIENAWRNEEFRHPWFSKGDKRFTEVHAFGAVYVEKTGADEFEIQRYAATEEYLLEEGYGHIRAAKVYFQEGEVLLMEKVQFEYNARLPGTNPVEANEEAQDELWRILQIGISMDWGIERNGSLVIIDPHMPLRGL